MINKILFLSFLFFYIPNAYAEIKPSRIGYAYDKSSNQLLYTENHYEDYRDGLVFKSSVIYKDPQANIIARKKVDFTHHNFMPNFSLTNSRTGHKESAYLLDHQYEISFIKTAEESGEDIRLEYPKAGVSDAGFDNFIKEYWFEIIKGEVFIRDFLIPSMMDFIKFRIYQDKVIEEEGKRLRLINIEPDSFIIRAFAGTTKLFYEEKRPALVRFDGLSNMRDEKGNNLNVIIQYSNKKQALK